MSDRRDETALASALEEIGEGVAFPATPDLAGAVTARIRSRNGAHSRPARHLRLSLALALVATLLTLGTALAGVMLIGGVRLVFDPSQPARTASPATQTPLGTLSSLAAAEAAVPFELARPSLPSLGQPDRTYLDSKHPVGGTVTLEYDLPTQESPLRITEFEAAIAPEVFDKLLIKGVSVETVHLNGTVGYWIAGGGHYFAYRDANGRWVQETLRLVGDTLLWEQYGLTLRIENADSKASAVQIAGSMVASK